MKQHTTSEVFNKVNEGKKLTIREISDKTGITTNNVKRQMNNDRLEFSTILKLAECFGLKLILETKRGKQYTLKNK